MNATTDEQTICEVEVELGEFVEERAPLPSERTPHGHFVSEGRLGSPL